MGIWVNLSFPLREYFLALLFSCPDAINPISRMSNVGEILTLNGFSTDSIHVMPLLSFSLLGSVTCLGQTVIFSMSNSHWLTSKIASEVRILVMRFSYLNYVSLEDMKWVTRKPKFVQFNKRYGRLRPKTIPRFVCFPHWRNSGRGSSWDLGILEIMLYG